LLLQEAYRHLVLKQAVSAGADEISADEDIIEEVI